MGKTTIESPVFLYPKKDPALYCECQERPVELTHKTCTLFWLKKTGDTVTSGEVIAEIAAEKKTVELLSPADGLLAEVCVENGNEFIFGTVLGYINTP